MFPLPDIPYIKLHFCFHAMEPASLPFHKGSMLRGAFGHALKRTVCVMGRDQSCETCMLRKQCVYTRIFETFIEGDPPPFLHGLKTSPRPFIIDASDPKREYKISESLEFDMTLLGKAWELHPYIIFAFSLAAKRGFTVRRHRFQLKKVDWCNRKWQLLYDGDKQCLCNTATPIFLPKNRKLNPPLTLKFLTPTRLKIDNKLTMDFTFRMLVFNMLRRALEIAHFHVPDAKLDWDFHELLEMANDIKILKKRLYWEDWKRYSSSQKTKLEMGGFFGDLVLEGDLEPFNRLLHMSEVLHVGKGTVFGLGKVRVEETNL